MMHRVYRVSCDIDGCKESQTADTKENATASAAFQRAGWRTPRYTEKVRIDVCPTHWAALVKARPELAKENRS